MNSVEYFRTCFSESDRGCVLIVAGELDRMLKELHEAKKDLESSASQGLRKRLFHGHGPLSTFASRIQLGFAYGLMAAHHAILESEIARRAKAKS